MGHHYLYCLQEFTFVGFLFVCFLRKIQPLKLLQHVTKNCWFIGALVNFHFGVISGKLKNPREAEYQDRLIHV